jgi:OPA family glycerol-3-phosphate transporter-like MFS transporter
MDGSKGVTGLSSLCWLVYFAANLGRLNLSVNLSAISAAEGISKDELGLMAALFFFAYGGGQLASGIIAERFRPVRLVGLGIFFTGLVNMAVAFSTNIRIMQWCWLLNGIAQSLLWIPMLRILTENLSEPHCIRVCIYISATGPAGMFCTYGISAASLYFSTWRMSFFAAGLFIIAITVLWVLRFSKNTGKKAIKTLPLRRREAGSSGKAESSWPLRRLMTASGLAPLIGISCLHGVLKDGVTTWLPAYLVDTFAVSTGYSALLAMAFPLFNLAGIYVVHYVSKMVFKNEVDCSLFLFAAVMAILLALTVAPQNLIFSLIALGMVASAMTAINTLLITLIPLRFTRTGRITIVTGLLNTSAYMGSGMAGYGFGKTAEHFSWGIVNLMWCGTAAAALLLCLIVRGAWKSFTGGPVYWIPNPL